jgi:hypothetical protein
MPNVGKSGIPFANALTGAGHVPIGNMNIKKEYVYSRTFRAADDPQDRLSAD